ASPAGFVADKPTSNGEARRCTRSVTRGCTHNTGQERSSRRRRARCWERSAVRKERGGVLGEEREFLTIKILHNDMTVNVPADNADRVGLRKVIDEQMVSKVLKALTGNGTTMPKNWNRRFKHNRDKMKTGDIFELAEVVRNLSLRDHEKGLSTGEKQMFVKAKKILASELMYAKEMDEDEAAEWLDDVLSTVSGGKKKTTKVAAAASA